MLFDVTTPFDLPPRLAARHDDAEQTQAAPPFASKAALLAKLEVIGGDAVEVRKRLIATDCFLWLDGGPVERAEPAVIAGTEEAAR